LWGEDKCAEFFGEDLALGDDAGAGICGAAEKAMDKDATAVDLLQEAAKNIGKARIARSSDLASVVQHSIDLAVCTAPQLLRLVNSL
jgi:hypothetical protein